MSHKKNIKYPDIESNFSDNALSIMEKHYYMKNSDGSYAEDCPSDVFKRICDFYYRNGVSSDKCKKLYEYLMMQLVTFNSPLYYNVVPEKDTAQIFACFMSEFKDSIEGITDELAKAAKIFQKGAGVGINYSDLRPKGASIGDSAKSISEETGSSGPVSFLKLFNKLGNVIRSSGKRRAAHLACLNCDHPDIEEFVECKSDQEKRSDFESSNLSVYINDDFMEAVKKEENLELKWNSVKYGDINAKELFDKICHGATTCGDPGVLFGDKVQEYNTIAEYNGKPFVFKTSNPCQPGWASVITQDGLRTFDDIDVGSVIWTKDGWSKVLRKGSSGIKDVYLYRTSASAFCGTETHRVLSNGEKVEVSKAKTLECLSGPITPVNIDLDKAKDIIYNNTIGENEVFSTIGVSNNRAATVLSSIFSFGGIRDKGSLSFKLASQSIASYSQLLLSSLGISSYIIKSEDSYGEEVFNIIITKDISQFLNTVGIMSRPKNEISMINMEDANTEGADNKIIETTFLSTEEVFNITVDNESNTYWTGGSNVSNCGEIFQYAPNFSCVLGHINLYKIYKVCQKGGVGNEMENFFSTISSLSSFLSDFLDLNIDLNEYPHKDFEAGTISTRPIGLGVMGFGEMLMAMGIKYGSDDSASLAEKISEEMTLSALEAGNRSEKSYPELKNKKNRERLISVLSKYMEKSINQRMIKRWKILIDDIKAGGNCRNCAVTTVAPTGTTGNVCDSGTTGIEPQFALFYKRNVVDLSSPLIVVDEEFAKYTSENKIKNIEKAKTDGKIPDYFIEAHNVDAEGRIKVQAAFQKFIMFGISSTINLPKTATAEDVSKIYKLAWSSDLKGITVFVDGCLNKFGISQVLESGNDSSDIIEIEDKPYKEQNRILKIKLTKTKQKMVELEEKLSFLENGFNRPKSLKGETFKCELSHSNGIHEFYVDVNEFEGAPVEIKITLGKSGNDDHAWGEATGRLISMSLQAGVPLSRVCRQLRGIGGDLGTFVRFRDDQIKSTMVRCVPDCIAALLEYMYLNDKIIISGAQECPSCKNISLVYEGGCNVCKNSSCLYKGSCG